MLALLVSGAGQRLRWLLLLLAKGGGHHWRTGFGWHWRWDFGGVGGGGGGDGGLCQIWLIHADGGSVCSDGDSIVCGWCLGSRGQLGQIQIVRFVL